MEHEYPNTAKVIIVYFQLHAKWQGGQRRDRRHSQNKLGCRVPNIHSYTIIDTFLTDFPVVHKSQTDFL